MLKKYLYLPYEEVKLQKYYLHEPIMFQSTFFFYRKERTKKKNSIAPPAPASIDAHSHISRSFPCNNELYSKNY
ncbi:hypothetical protein BRADI_3g57325v3 [Brachypodium distachyon]|uniref:Uncharacterized protein n=1 Tax=Brachypodium distachyon TaxID=15368 RepID=A0A2K2D5I9_BRADI|nr:hypothetical protein BRADI_3g57325v3 [Brachypodium distachyon]